jgi:hypothetical protein
MFQDEINFLKERKEIVIFPYKTIKHLGNIIFGYDASKKLSFVRHNDRKLFFPDSSIEEISKIYRHFIETENILGGNYAHKAPHQYQSETCHIKSSDILLDIGCAEALFTLDVIDKVKKAILFESDPIWFVPLKATFEKEIASGKVVLIKKMVSDKNTLQSVTISSVLQNEEFESLFIKMDIEGCEPNVVKSCENWMNSDKDIRFSCCTYHRHNDAEILKSIFEQHQYKTEFSDGYMLFFLDKHLKYPYFRKGLIRATNKLYMVN